MLGWGRKGRKLEKGRVGSRVGTCGRYKKERRTKRRLEQGWKGLLRVEKGRSEEGREK